MVQPYLDWMSTISTKNSHFFTGAAARQGYKADKDTKKNVVGDMNLKLSRCVICLQTDALHNTLLGLKKKGKNDHIFKALCLSILWRAAFLAQNGHFQPLHSQ